jgi:hypothetical protein
MSSFRTPAQWLAEKEALAQLCATGKSPTKIATLYGAENAVIGQVLDELGLRTLRSALRGKLQGIKS